MLQSIKKKTSPNSKDVICRRLFLKVVSWKLGKKSYNHIKLPRVIQVFKELDFFFSYIRFMRDVYACKIIHVAM